jgi:tyrosyl-tRNA synthetase
LLTQAEIEALIEEHKAAPHLRILQKKLAEEITVTVHGREALNKAIAASEILFGKGTTEQLQQLEEEEILDIFKGVPQHEVTLDSVLSSTIVDFLSLHTQVLPSKGEARRMLQANGISVNKQKVNESLVLNKELLLRGKYLLIQKGKKEYHLVKVTG